MRCVPGGVQLSGHAHVEGIAVSSGISVYSNLLQVLHRHAAQRRVKRAVGQRPAVWLRIQVAHKEAVQAPVAPQLRPRAQSGIRAWVLGSPKGFQKQWISAGSTVYLSPLSPEPAGCQSRSIGKLICCLCTTNTSNTNNLQASKHNSNSPESKGPINIQAMPQDVLLLSLFIAAPLFYHHRYVVGSMHTDETIA